MLDFKIENPNKPVDSQIFFQETGKYLIAKDDGFYVRGAESQAEANALISAHNPPAPKEPTVEEKLASVGLSLDDLKVALGL